MNRLWLWITAILAALFTGMKLRGDHYKAEAEETEEALAGAEAEGSLIEFEAAQAERHKNAIKEIEKGKPDEKDDPDIITTAVD